MYNTTLDAELIKEIKVLAARLDKRQNDLLEEAIQDLLKKYKSQDSLDASNGWMRLGAMHLLAAVILKYRYSFWVLARPLNRMRPRVERVPVWIYAGGSVLDSMVYIGFGLIAFGLAFFLYMLLTGKPEKDD